MLASAAAVAYLLHISPCGEGQGMAGGKDWRHRSAPTLSEFEELAGLAWRRLPAEFRAMCGNVLIRIDDFPTEECLDSLQLERPFDLMWLYHGVSLDRKSVSDLPRGPDMVFLYRRPLLDVWAEGTETLGDLVTHVLVHEIGHHFGLSDKDMARIEDAAIERNKT